MQSPAVPPAPPAFAVEPASPPPAVRNPVTLAGFDRGAAEDLHGTARAVEIAAMLGDSVIGVKHCLDPRGGRISPTTWGGLAGAAVCLIASAIAFTASLHNAADEQARLDTWIRIEHRPAARFRPHRLGPAADAIAFGGAGLALIGAAIGLLRLRRERVSPYFRIGTAPGVDLAVDGAPAPAFPLVAPAGDGFAFHFAPGIDGELIAGGTPTPLAALAATGRARPSTAAPGALAVAIGPDLRIRARIGRAAVLISAVAPPRRGAIPARAGVDHRIAAYIAGSLAAHLAIWAVLQLLPPDATSISVELPTGEAIATRLTDTAPDDAIAPPSEQPGERGGDPGSAAMTLPAGAAGDPSLTVDGRMQVAHRDTPPQPARGPAIEQATTAGVLGNRQLIASIDQIAALPDLASGFDLRSTRGAIDGAFDGDGSGQFFGGGRTGFGFGTSCSEAPCGLIRGATGFSTIGPGPGAGGYDLPGRGIGQREHYPIVPRIGTPVLTGGAGYDKAIIRRYIRRNLDKIGYCYDKQLLAHPTLGGDLVARFFIAPTGDVQSASATGVDPEVDSCVADVIRIITFPRPGDGIGVEVSYPFHFHAATM